MKKILNLALALILVITGQAQKEKIAFNLSKGGVYLQKMNAATSITQTINGQQMDIHVAVSGAMSYTVTGIRDSLYDMDVRYESLSLKMALPTGVREFSSEKTGTTDVLSAVMGLIKGKVFNVTMTKTGKIIAVRNIESLFANVFEKFPQIPEIQKQQLQNQLMQSYGEKAFKGNIEMVTAVFPATEVATGEKWVVHTKLESGMPADVETTYKLKQVNDSSYLISGNGKITTADANAYIESNGIPLKYNMAGTIVAEIKIDRASGWIMQAAISQDISGTVQTKGDSQVPEGVTIPMTVKTEITITK